jgi:hypothetical protein
MNYTLCLSKSYKRTQYDSNSGELACGVEKSLKPDIRVLL